MFSRRLKSGYFVLEGLNSFGTVYYFYYFYFFMQQRFGYGNKANLALAALNGATYAVFAWWAGKFAQRFGYFNALKLGFGVMLAALGVGAFFVGSSVESAAGHIAVMVVTVMGMCFTWPTLEALVSEGESRFGLQHMVGVYNLVWAGTAALANFTGGAMLERLGLHSLFLVPIGILLTQIALTLWLEIRAKRAAEAILPCEPETGGMVLAAANLVSSQAAVHPQTSRLSIAHQAALVTEAPVRSPELRVLPAAQARSFLRMAWLVNPFAYIAINTLIAVIPGVARHLELSTTLAGFFCSAWCFARLGAFVALWRWNGWHYRFRWLLAWYFVLIASFATTLLAPNLAVVVLAQILFGGAIGLFYYSSLFYSMDVGETKGEHGGIHEAAIGLGNFVGPAIGALALQFFSQYPSSGTVAISLTLLCGLGGLLLSRIRTIEQEITERTDR
jgi:predicted MFS family arabinose efflux permease